MKNLINKDMSDLQFFFCLWKMAFAFFWMFIASSFLIPFAGGNKIATMLDEGFREYLKDENEN